MSDGRLIEDLGGVAGLLLLDDADEVALQRGHSATGTAVLNKKEAVMLLVEEAKMTLPGCHHSMS